MAYHVPLEVDAWIYGLCLLALALAVLALYLIFRDPDRPRHHDDIEEFYQPLQFYDWFNEEEVD